ncbi:MAG TPA: hypothetical protein VLJ16_01230, partial [Acidobacteriota bacterium]|nr:hypothetical protein [Acidobacteriota bacterium]
GEASARAVLARVEAELGRTEECRKEASQARTQAAKSQNRGFRLAMTIECARLLGRTAEEERSAALEALARAQAEAERAGLVPQVLEARLARAEIEARWAPDEGRPLLVELQKDAEARGFKRIAGLAAAASR